MRLFQRRQARRRDLDERVEQARREAEESRRRLQSARENVVTPLSGRGNRNHFSDLIRDLMRMSVQQGGHHA